MGRLPRARGSGQFELIRDLQALAGNAAVTRILQRQPSGPDPGKGEHWNDTKAYAVGRMWRMEVTGLKGGTDEKFLDDDSAHTEEPADHRAIVVIPDGFQPDKTTEVLLYFHGHTETWRGRYAGWRERTFRRRTKDIKKTGLVSDATVRDVALDQIEQQLQASGHAQMIGILPQGGAQHQFGKINADEYIADVLEHTKSAHPDRLKAVPDSWKVVIAGHSGGGTEVADIVSGKDKPKNLEAILLFDAESMKANISARVSEDLAFLSDITKTDAERKAYLDQRPAVRVTAREKGKYGPMYATVVDDAIDRWMADHKLSARQKTELAGLQSREACDPKDGCKALGAGERRQLDRLAKRQAQVDAVTAFLPNVRDLYRVTLTDEAVAGHEDIIRGAHADSGDYQPGQGNLEKALHTIP